MSEERIVVIGASAGGVDALIRFVRALPRDFPAPILAVLHVPPDSPSLMPHILSREGSLPAKSAVDGERYEPGTIYIAPPDRHLLVGGGGRLHVARGPRENRHRPAVDPLFRSAALHYGRRAIGVILSGTLDDGTAGLLAIRQQHGITVVQDPSDALYPGMPQSAIEHVAVDHIVPIARLAPLLTYLVAEEPPEREAKPPLNLVLETRMAALDTEALAGDVRPGTPSPFSCPDCSGVLWEIEDGEYARFRCRVGHAFSPENMLSAQNEELEAALWSAMKTLEESARLSHRLASSERQRGHDWLADRFTEKENDARRRVEIIRKFLLRGDDATVPVAEAGERSR